VSWACRQGGRAKDADPCHQQSESQMTDTQREDLIQSARTKLAAAEVLVKGRAPHPAPAAYLIHVTLECAFKVSVLHEAA